MPLSFYHIFFLYAREFLSQNQRREFIDIIINERFTLRQRSDEQQKVKLIYEHDPSPRDIPQILLSVLFLALMIIACLWIVQPFILGFAWAATIVIATWPVLLWFQRLLFGRRSLAVLVMTLLLFLLFVIPISLLVNSLVDGSTPLVHAITSGNLTLPDLAG